MGLHVTLIELKSAFSKMRKTLSIKKISALFFASGWRVIKTGGEVETQLWVRTHKVMEGMTKN